MALLDRFDPKTIVLGDKAYDGNAIRDLIESQSAVPNIPAKSNRKWRPCFSKTIYRERNQIEHFFSKIKHFRRIATRYDKLANNFLAMVKLASCRLWQRATNVIGQRGRRPPRLSTIRPLPFSPPDRFIRNISSRLSHASSSPSAIMPFLSNRFSNTRLATHSFMAPASRRSCYISSTPTLRAVCQSSERYCPPMIPTRSLT